MQSKFSCSALYLKNLFEQNNLNPLLIYLCKYTSKISYICQQNKLTMLQMSGKAQIFGQKVACLTPGVFTLIYNMITSSKSDQ